MDSEKARPKIVVVLGQTAVGKSDFAVQIAKDFDGEIVSADSRQVYKGTLLLAGTINDQEMHGIPHHLLSFRDISQPYSVVEFVRDASAHISDIVSRGKTPIVCGGTAMYIDALIYNQIFPSVQTNDSLRAELSSKSTEELCNILKYLDPVRASTIDTQNPRRLVRAIEIATALGSVPEITHGDSKYDTLIIGLTRPKPELDARIKERIKTRMQEGMLREIFALHSLGNTYDYLRTFGLEFSTLSDMAEGKKTEEKALQELYFDIVHFAKRQKTWWKKNESIIWLLPDEYSKAHDLAYKFIKNKT